MFKILLEWLVILAVWAIVVTQIILPSINKKPLFPLFNRKLRKAEADLAQANEQVEINEIVRKTQSVTNGESK